MDMDNLIVENRVILGYRTEQSHVVIPEGVVEIGEAAFKECLWLESIEIKSAIFRTIGDKAFQGCKNLQNVIIRNLSGAIGAYAFDKCSQLESLDIPYGAMEIGEKAFNACVNLNDVTIPSSVMVIGDSAFSAWQSKRLLFLCDTNSEAGQFAEKENIPYRQDLLYIRNALESARKARKGLCTRTFNLFGQKITAPNSLAYYDEIPRYYQNEKTTFYNNFLSNLPASVFTSVNGKKITGDLDVLVQRTLKRLEKYGIFVSSKQIEADIITAYTNIATVILSADEFQKKLVEVGNANLASCQEILLQEAESKVTGLSYGVIGDPLSLALYAVDDYRERQQQRRAAYYTAEQQYNAYVSRANSEIESAYKRFYTNTAVPALRTGTDALLDSLCSAELRLLKEYGLLEEVAEGTYNAKKSAEIISCAYSGKMDKEYATGLALKTYPLNVYALEFAGKFNTATDELLEFVDFMHLSDKSEMSDMLKSSMITIEALLKFCQTSKESTYYKAELANRCKIYSDKIDKLASGQSGTNTANEYQTQIEKIVPQELWVEINKITPILSKQLIDKLEILRSVSSSIEVYHSLGERIYNYNNRHINALQRAKDVVSSSITLEEKINALYKDYSVLGSQKMSDLLRSDFIAYICKMLAADVPAYTGFNHDEIEQDISNKIKVYFPDEMLRKIRYMGLSISYADSGKCCKENELKTVLPNYYIETQKEKNLTELRGRLLGVVSSRIALEIAKDYLGRVDGNALFAVMGYYMQKICEPHSMSIQEQELPDKTTYAHIQEIANREVFSVLGEDEWITYYIIKNIKDTEERHVVSLEDKARRILETEKRKLEEKIRDAVYDNYVNADPKRQSKEILDLKLKEIEKNIVDFESGTNIPNYVILPLGTLLSLAVGVVACCMDMLTLGVICILVSAICLFVTIVWIPSWVKLIGDKRKAAKLMREIRKITSRVKW